jgi:hypothetical protein
VAYRKPSVFKKVVLAVSGASDWGMWVRCLRTVLITPSRVTSDLGGPLLYCILKKLRYLTSGQCYQAGGYKEMSSIVADQYCALVYEPKCGGRGGGVAGSQPMSTAVHRSPTNFGDLTPYLTYGIKSTFSFMPFLSISYYAAVPHVHGVPIFTRDSLLCSQNRHQSSQLCIYVSYKVRHNFPCCVVYSNIDELLDTCVENP